MVFKGTFEKFWNWIPRPWAANGATGPESSSGSQENQNQGTGESSLTSSNTIGNRKKKQKKNKKKRLAASNALEEPCAEQTVAVSNFPRDVSNSQMIEAASGLRSSRRSADPS